MQLLSMDAGARSYCTIFVYCLKRPIHFWSNICVYNFLPAWSFINSRIQSYYSAIFSILRPSVRICFALRYSCCLFVAVISDATSDYYIFGCFFRTPCNRFMYTTASSSVHTYLIARPRSPQTPFFTTDHCSSADYPTTAWSTLLTRANQPYASVSDSALRYSRKISR